MFSHLASTLGACLDHVLNIAPPGQELFLGGIRSDWGSGPDRSPSSDRLGFLIPGRAWPMSERTLEKLSLRGRTTRCQVGPRSCELGQLSPMREYSTGGYSKVPRDASGAPPGRQEKGETPRRSCHWRVSRTSRSRHGESSRRSEDGRRIWKIPLEG